VRIHGIRRPVRAKIAHIHGFSAHADRNGLMRWLSKLAVAPRHIFVTHGEKTAALHFAAYLAEKTDYETSVPSYGTRVSLE
jgi:metallo-beta-lactamase family protein